MNVFEEIVKDAIKKGNLLTVEYQHLSGIIIEREVTVISIDGEYFKAKCELGPRYFSFDRVLSIQKKLR